MVFQRAGEFIECCSRGHDVVHHDDGSPAQVCTTFEGVADVPLPFLPGQGCLGSRFACAQDIRETKSQAEGAGERLCHFQRLIESAFPQPSGRKGDGYQCGIAG